MAADVSEDAAMCAMVDASIYCSTQCRHGSMTRVEDLSDGEFRRMMAVHVFGARREANFLGV